jgi:ABC-type sugar transport system ATPase subunit
MKDGQVVITDSTSAFNYQKLISSMVGRKISEIFPVKHGTNPNAKVLVTFDGILKQSGKRIAFSIREGEVTAIGGLQGQGQIELLKSFFGIGEVDRLRLTINNNPVHIKNPIQAMRHGIAYIPENRNEEGVFLILSVMENLAANTINRHSRSGFIKLKEERSVVQNMIESLSIQISSVQQIAQSLSGGNMQKLVIGKWLIFDPRVIVLMEPTKGVDIATKQQIYLLIQKLADRGVAVIVNTSDMLELVGLCDRVLIMNGGAITACLEGDEITEENIMEASVSRKDIIAEGAVI